MEEMRRERKRIEEGVRELGMVMELPNTDEAEEFCDFAMRLKWKIKFSHQLHT